MDWSNMLSLIHLTNMESTLKTQYLNAGNITARINLHAEYSVNKQGWFNWIYEQSNIQTGQRILEIGCGDGRLWVDNKNNVRELSGLQVFLSDISDGMVNDARRNIEAEYANENGADSTAHKTGQPVSFKFNTFDCADIPYRNNYFDIVLANHVLFYCDNIESVLKEVKRVLKPGGVFICATYGASHMKEISDLVTEFDKRIVLAADNLYDKFGLDNGEDILIKHFNNELYFHHPVLKGEYVFCRNFILEGGSIESDGKGSLLTTEQCLLAKNRNEMNRQEVEDFLKETFNLKQVLWLKHGYLAGDDTDSHVDTLARFCPDDTIVYVKCTNEKDEHYKELAMMEEELKAFRTLDGRPYRLLPLPMASAVYDEEHHRLPATYANFLIMNEAVLYPTYADFVNDMRAKEVLAEAFPGREIVGIDCTALIKQHGSLHCATMQYPEGVY